MPLVGAAWLPWWTVAGLTLALALTWREGESRSARVPLLLLGGLAGLLALLPGLRGAAGAVAFGGLFLTALGGTALTLLAVTALEERRPVWASVWLGALLLLGPVLGGGASPLGLGVGALALVLTLLGAPGAEARPTLRLPGGGAVLRVMGVGVLTAALVALLALAVPGGGGREAAREAGGPPPVASSELPSPVPAGSQAGSPGASSPSPSSSPAPPGAQPGTDLALVGGVLLLLAVAFLMRRTGKAVRAGRRPAWWEFAAVFGLLVTAGLVLVYGASVGGGGPGGVGGTAGTSGADLGGTATAEEARAASLREALARWVSALSLVSFVVLTVLAAAVLWVALRLKPERTTPEAAVGTPDTPAPGETPALHRVRVAYRSAQATLAGAGLGRGDTETPAEHARRAVQDRPDLAAPLNILVAAYAPVRYGGRVTNEDAEAAEGAAREVADLLREETTMKGRQP